MIERLGLASRPCRARPRPVPSRSRRLLGGGFGSERPAAAQSSVYYGEVDATLRSELAQWSAYYWNRVDTGAKAKVGEFAFTNAALNNPLFSPLRGARPTLEQVKVLNSSDCDGLAALQPGWGDTAIAAAFRDAMKDWKFSTDTTTNATGSAIHVALITAAPPEAGATWSSQGNLIISEKLPLVTVGGQNEEPTIATGVSSATQAAINKIILIGPIIAAASAGTTEAQSLITGEESHATKFERGVRTLLADGGWVGTTWRVDAAFGVFGSLPLVGVTFSDAFVLVDSVNGGVSAAFSLSSSVDATLLLGAHSAQYLIGQPIRYMTLSGCATDHQAGWWPLMPHPVSPRPPATPGSTCVPVNPPWAPPPAPPLCMDSTVPGWMTLPTCVFAAAVPPTPGPGTCTCTEYGHHTGGPGVPIVWVRSIYQCPAGPAGTCPPAGYPTGCTLVIDYWW
ncbi:MAG: hypothetical protein IT438_16985 [Phycisphaerales bacterium]|nr:hypothetical protein [Phycisphaerales bacterium]